LKREKLVASTPAVAVAVESNQHLLVAPEVEVMAQHSVHVLAAARRSAVRAQHFGPAEEAVCCAVVFEQRHSGLLEEAAAEAVDRVEKAAQVVLKHCSPAARIAAESALVVVLRHCLPAARTVAEEAAQVVVLRHCFLAVRTVVEEAAQLVAPEHCLAVAMTAAEVAA
jgi:hypothetical protein